MFSCTCHKKNVSLRRNLQVMKKIVFCLMALGMCLLAQANEPGHFFVDLSAKHVGLSEVTSSFGSYTTLPEGSTFELFRDTTDALGVRHLSYQQYYQGLKVQNHMILVHAKDGLVSFIHGHIMTEAPSLALSSFSWPISAASLCM